MSSINMGSFNSSASNVSGGFKMGNMSGDSNGGANFFMGGDQQETEEERLKREEEERKNQENSALSMADPLLVAESIHARQYWEQFITVNNSLNQSASPWQIPPQQNLRERGRKDVIVRKAAPRHPLDQFSVNA